MYVYDRERARRLAAKIISISAIGGTAVRFGENRDLSRIYVSTSRGSGSISLEADDLQYNMEGSQNRHRPHGEENTRPSTRC